MKHQPRINGVEQVFFESIIIFVSTLSRGFYYETFPLHGLCR